MKELPLRALHQARGAAWMEYGGYRIPAEYSGVRQEYEALQEGAGLVDLSYRGLIAISGRDARSWLHGQVTQDVKNLPEGRSAYACVITPQGRMICDMWIMAAGEVLWCDFPLTEDPEVVDYLNRYLIMERAEIEDLSHTWASLSLQGPRSLDAVGAVLGEEMLTMQPGEVRLLQRDTPLLAARIPHSGEDGVDLYLPNRAAAGLWAEICRSRGPLGVHSAGWRALNLRRLEAGTPWWGRELDGTVVPLEARLDHAVHFDKGCYVGQEIMARIHARGHVNNLLTGFYLDMEEDRAELAEGALLYHEERKAGRITSAAASYRAGRVIALGYLRRELLAPGTVLTARTDEEHWNATVVELPFLPDDSP